MTLGELDEHTDLAQPAYEIDALGLSVLTRSRLLDGDASAVHWRAETRQGYAWSSG